MEPRSIQFATAARRLADEAARNGLVAPCFKSPPRAPGANRSLRHGSAPGMAGPGLAAPAPMVAVRLAGRPFGAVVADMVEGVVAVNQLHGARAAACRRTLWAALHQSREAA